MQFTKFIFFLILMASVCGCSAGNINSRGVTERRLSDFNGTMAYASDSELDTQTVINPSKLILSEYTTKFNEKADNRAANIKLASDEINQKIVLPGEMFSFNDAVGPTNKESGYKRSKIFVKGKELDGYGGGVCQVSSTLYNAVNRAGLNVIERHSHSKNVKYVPKNHDAAVSYGGIDFKFLNDFEFPIKIHSFVSDGIITVNLEGISA